MSTTERQISGWLKWGLIGLAWTLFALFFASQKLMAMFYLGRPLELRETLIAWFICASLWFALTPFALRMAERFPLDRRKWLSNGFVHLFASLAFAFFQEALFILVGRWIGLIDRLTYFTALRNQLIYGAHFSLITYWSIIALSHAWDYYSKFHERERRTLQLETKLAQAELDALKMQIHPHFLFNTLNSISVLMGEDVAAARHMLNRLSDLLRTSLDSAGRHEVMLKEELDFLASYLEIEQIRFQDRLTVHMDIDPATLPARVPNFILQPLVENAIRHGIAPRATPSSIEIRSVRDNGFVELQVCDDGPGAPAAIRESLSKGIGLSNTRARLEQIYGTAHGFDISQPEAGGFRVTIKIPFKTEADGPSAQENIGTDDSDFNRR
jgi:two-component system, LytTR family, sensor kinase